MNELAYTRYNKDQQAHALTITKEALEFLCTPIKDDPMEQMTIEVRSGALWGWTTDGHRLHAVQIGKVDFTAPHIERFALPANRLLWELKFGKEDAIRVLVFDCHNLGDEPVEERFAGLQFKSVHRGSENRDLVVPYVEDDGKQGWKTVPHDVSFGKGEIPKAVNAEYLAHAAKIAKSIHIGTTDVSDVNAPFVVASHLENPVNCDWFAVLLPVTPRLNFGESDEPTTVKVTVTHAPDMGVDDPLYKDAVEFVIERGEASTSMLQRKFSIGFGRASKLLDAMERENVVGPRNGPSPRQVLIKPVEPHKKKEGRFATIEPLNEPKKKRPEAKG